MASRLRIAAKLALLLGMPIGLVVTLFSSGVYVGASHRHPITRFEKEWLGMNVEVAPPPEPAQPDESPAVEPAPAAGPPSEATKQPQEAEVEPDERAGPEQPAAAQQPSLTEPATGPSDSLAGELAAKMKLPVTVRLKVLVDEELVAERPDWIDYVQRTVSEASSIYETQFGIALELVSVGRWPVPTAGMSVEELHRDAAHRFREGADALIGMTNRPFDGTISGRADTPAGGSPFNGAYAVVYATPGSRKPHLRTFLHEIAHLFGALDITDPASDAWRAGSWMSYAAVGDERTAWIDADNRQRILMRKDRPFAPETGER